MADQKPQADGATKKLCPFKTSCYRTNPIHLSEMSHPHLENLVIDRLDKDTKIPEKLPFKAGVSSEKLLEQLKVVQYLLKKERDKNKSSENNSSKQCSKFPLPEEVAAAATSKSEENFTQKRQAIDGSKDSSKRARRLENATILENSIDDNVEKVRSRAIEMMKRMGLKVSLAPRGEFALKHALSAPYHLFFTRVDDSKATYDQQLSITFPEILDKSLGEIESSLHLNFIIHAAWLVLQYMLSGQKNDMLLILGDRCDGDKDEKGRTKFNDLPKTVKVVELKEMPTPYGIHHSKVSLLKYVDGGIRLVVSTANLYPDDWQNRTQGLWISPHLPPLPESSIPSDGESPTNFKRDFEKYLLSYKQAALLDWIYLVRRADFSSVNVFFLASVPGSYKGTDSHSWGHRKLGKILSQNASLPPNAPHWPIVALSSSIGSLGPNFSGWLSTDIVPSLTMEINRGMKSLPDFQFIYPSIKDFEGSFDCRVASCCLPYSMKVHSKQEWLQNYLHRWKSDDLSRTEAMPHIKCYTRISPDYREIPWFVLTSANLSKAAWGSGKSSHYMMNYEAGIVFIPKFIINATNFPIKSQKMPEVPVFPMPYDLPLTKYLGNDKPFVTEFFNV